MQESIIIKNFGPLKDIAITDLKPLMVLIGSSSSGKSTLIKVIALMRYLYKMVNISSFLKNADVADSIFKLSFNSLLKDGLESMISADTIIHYSVTIDGRRYTISFENERLTADLDIPNSDLIFFKESFIAQSRNLIPLCSPQALQDNSSSIGFFFNETLCDFEAATDVIKELKLDCLNVTFKVNQTALNSKQYLIEPVHKGTPIIELKHAPSSIQAAVPLLAIVHYCAKEFSFKDELKCSTLQHHCDHDLLEQLTTNLSPNDMDNYVHIYIEEPEQGLDPDAQRALVNSLIDCVFHKKSSEHKMSLMFSTHSPYVLNQLNVLIRASYSDYGQDNYPFIAADNIAVYSLNDGELCSLMAEDLDTNKQVINTFDLSEPMERIFEEYEHLDPN